MRSLKPVKLFLPLLQPKNPAGLQLHTHHYRQTAVDSWSIMCRYTLIKSFALNWHRLISLCVYSMWLCLSLACMRVCVCVKVCMCVCVCVCVRVCTCSGGLDVTIMMDAGKIHFQYGKLGERKWERPQSDWLATHRFLGFLHMWGTSLTHSFTSHVPQLYIHI